MQRVAPTRLRLQRLLECARWETKRRAESIQAYVRDVLKQVEHATCLTL